MLGGHVLVIEGDHVTALRERAERVEVAVVADDDIADDLRRGILRSVTEELEPDAQRDACLVCHTSELAPADHADYRERHTPRVSAAPPAADFRPFSALLSRYRPFSVVLLRSPSFSVVLRRSLALSGLLPGSSRTYPSLLPLFPPSCQPVSDL